ncbi:hypothetical protein AVEN_25307-1, partial [Araneus ventricosus]
ALRFQTNRDDIDLESAILRFERQESITMPSQSRQIGIDIGSWNQSDPLDSNDNDFITMPHRSSRLNRDDIGSQISDPPIP